LKPEERESIRVCHLPQGVSTAGEWYLSVPRHSAAPSVGLEIIKLMTSRQADIERVNSGAGLPVRKDIYSAHFGSRSDGAAVPEMRVSPFFSLDPQKLYEVFNHAIRRSKFRQYRKISEALSGALRSILEFEEASDNDRDERVRLILAEMDLSVRFLGS